MPTTNRVYGDPIDHHHLSPNARPYEDNVNGVVGGCQPANTTTGSTSVMMNNNNHQSGSASTPHGHNGHMQQQFHHQQGMHILQQQHHQQQQQHSLHIHQLQHTHLQQQQHPNANHHHLAYQQFSVGGQHVNLARHLLATGQAHQQAMHNTGSANQTMKGMLYHNGMGIRSTGVVPLNASK